MQADEEVSRVETAPLLRGILTQINGVSAREVAGDHWVIEGDRGITYLTEAPPPEEVVEGEWWPDAYAGPPLVAFAAEEAREIGLGLGDTFVCKKNGNSFEFAIVGFVTSPGIELVSKFFNVGAEFEQQAVHAVFGSRDDLKTKLGSDAIHLIQIDLRDDVDDAEAMATIRDELFEYAILDAGSGREIRDEIVGFITQSLVAMSSIAIASMLIASLGVANLNSLAYEAVLDCGYGFEGTSQEAGEEVW